MDDVKLRKNWKEGLDGQDVFKSPQESEDTSKKSTCNREFSNEI